MASQIKDLEVICEFCKKPYIESTILRHISKNESCKTFYGPRFTEMKKKKLRIKVFKCKNKNQKAYNRQTERRRELYAKNTDLKEKNRDIYQKNKEQIREKNKKERAGILHLIAGENAEKISKEKKTPNILYKSCEKLEELKKVWVPIIR